MADLAGAGIAATSTAIPVATTRMSGMTQVGIPGAAGGARKATRLGLLSAISLAAVMISSTSHAGLFSRAAPAAAAETPPSAAAPAAPRSAGIARVSQVQPEVLAEEGLKYLAEGDTDKARRLFSAAIKFAPTNGNYHLMLGISLHLQYQQTGSPDLRDQALAGYQIAARFLPSDARPVLQTARLHLDSREYAEAARVFAAGLEIKPADPDLLYGLAAASFLQGDLKTALWSAEELAKTGWNPADVDRLRATLFAAGNDRTLATRYRDDYAASLPAGSPDLATLDARLKEIGSMYDSAAWLRRPGGDMAGGGLQKAVLTTGGADEPAPGPGPGMGAPPPPPPPMDQSTMMAQAAPPPSVMAAPSPPPESAAVGMRPWYLCDQGPTPGGQQGIMAQQGGGGGGGADETQNLQALPTPCEGAAMPGMVVIDAVLLRTEDEVTRSFGVNLMQGLTAFFGLTETRSGTALDFLTRSATYGWGPANGTPLTYSLNIANATDNRNEVLARPTLLAIDRVPSTFFSGSTISIAVGGGSPGSVSQLVDKQVGVSFSITPTVIDGERVLLSVKAARSFVEPPATGTTGVALSTSRNAVSASVVATYGDTVILSGLTERQLIRGRSGVPLLKDIPAVQYMFQSDRSTDFFRTVMIMITLRKPVASVEDIAAVREEQAERARLGVPQRKKYAFYWRIEEYEQTLSKYAPNLDTALDTLQANSLYLTFKSKDIKDIDWSTVPKIQNMVRDMRLLMYR